LLYLAFKLLDNIIMPYILPATPLAEMKHTVSHYYRFRNWDRFSSDSQKKFLLLDCDAETERFLRGCQKIEVKPIKFILERFAYSFLTNFMMQTSIHALLDRGHMFVLSAAQIRKLLSLGNVPAGQLDSADLKVIDLGAGEGNVSKKVTEGLALTSHNKLQTTDISKTNKYRLRQKGFQVVDENSWYQGQNFDLVFMLNLLDRCEKPLSMLHQAHVALLNRPRSIFGDGLGRLVVALVFPIRQSIEWRKSRRADEPLGSDSYATLEEQVETFIKFVVTPAGFELEKFSRVPYLCEGDVTKPFFVFTNVVFLLKPVVGHYESETN